MDTSERAAEEIVAEMHASGEEPPVAIADKHYSGKFQVRVPEEVHRRLAIRAAEQGVSLNALASSRLAGAWSDQGPPTTSVPVSGWVDLPRLGPGGPNIAPCEPRDRVRGDPLTAQLCRALAKHANRTITYAAASRSGTARVGTLRRTRSGGNATAVTAIKPTHGYSRRHGTRIQFQWTNPDAPEGGGLTRRAPCQYEAVGGGAGRRWLPALAFGRPPLSRWVRRTCISARRPRCHPCPRGLYIRAYGLHEWGWQFIEWGEHIDRDIAPSGNWPSNTHSWALLGIDQHKEIYLVINRLATFGRLPVAMDHLILGHMPDKIA